MNFPASMLSSEFFRMGFVILALVTAAAIWVMAVFRRMPQLNFRFSFAIAGFAVVIVGSVLSSDFFQIDKGPIPITLDRVLLLVILAAFGCLVMRRRRSIRYPDSTDMMIAALMLLLAASALLTDPTYADNRPLSRFLFFYLMPVSVYFVVKNSQLKKIDLIVIASGLCLFGLYLAGTAIAESRGWYSLVFPAYIGDQTYIEFLGRARGPFMNPVSNGIFLTTGLAAAVALWWHSNWSGRLLFSIVVPVIVAGALATLTRSVWLGMLVGVGLVFWIPASRRQRATLFLTSACLGLLILLTMSQSLVKFKRDKHVSAHQMSESAQLRPIFMAVAWEMFKDRPLFGCGFGQYGRARFDYIQEPNSKLELRKASDYLQHNVLLSFLTETGLIGCGMLMLLLCKMYMLSWSLWGNNQATNWARSYALMMIALLTAYLINGMFHDVSIIPMANMLTFFMLAIVSNQHAEYSGAAAVNLNALEPQLANSQYNPPIAV